MIASLPTCILIIYQARLTCCAHLYGIQTGLGADDEDSHRSALFLNRIGQCQGLEKLPIFIPDARIVQLNTTHYVVSGIIRFRESLFEDLISGVVWIEQCNGSTKCQPFTSKVTFEDVCRVLDSMDSVFNTFLNRSSPVFKCPFRKGVYRFNDVVMDHEVFRAAESELLKSRSWSWIR